MIAMASLALCAVGVLSSCNKSKPEGQASAAKTEDWVDTSESTTEGKAYLAYGRGVVRAVSDRDYAAFHGQLSTQARSRMSLNQFAPADDEAVFARQEKNPEKNVPVERFIQLMQQCETRFGRPQQPLNLHIHSTEAVVLAGTQRGGIDGLDTMFAIGNMPDLAPAASRKASLRAKIRVELSPTQLAESAKAYQVSVEELQKDPDFDPYLTLKLVLTEHEGGLQVGYFEFLPPSMMD